MVVTRIGLAPFVLVALVGLQARVERDVAPIAASEGHEQGRYDQPSPAHSADDIRNVATYVQSVDSP